MSRCVSRLGHRAAVVLADLSRALREEERQAWQRLIRVLGHELNNSLAPIKSVAGSLADLLGRQPRPADWDDDMQRGLEVISSRADSLARFVESYSKLARLPQPRFEPLDVLLLGGLPIGEPIAHYGPFVMNTREEILQAVTDYQAGRMGRIPPVHGLTADSTP